MKIFLTVVLTLIVTILICCASGRDRSIKNWEKTEWQEVKSAKADEGSWTIYKRNVAATNFLEYKIVGKIPYAAKDCVTSFKKNQYQLASGSKIDEFPVYEITSEHDSGFYTYVIHDEPFPFRNTEMSVQYAFRQDGERTYHIEWHEAWNLKTLPKESKNLKRIEEFRGSWKFDSIATNACQGTKSVMFDLKGMPLWLAEPMVIKFLKEGLEELRIPRMEL